MTLTRSLEQFGGADGARWWPKRRISFAANADGTSKVSSDNSEQKQTFRFRPFLSALFFWPAEKVAESEEAKAETLSWSIFPWLSPCLCYFQHSGIEHWLSSWVGGVCLCKLRCLFIF
jgi:hypothetical protein